MDYPADVISTIRQNFYVDDCLKSVNTEEQAVALYRQLTEVCAKGGFRLNKWISNNRTLLSAIPEENRAKGVNQLDLSRDQLPMERALGVQWNVEHQVLFPWAAGLYAGLLRMQIFLTSFYLHT